MGWLVLLGLGAVAMGMLVALGVRRQLWSLAGAAVMLGATGYALQGSPALPGKPARPANLAAADEPGLIRLRAQMFGGLDSQQGAYLAAADAMSRAGEKRAAVQAVIGGLRRYPKNVMLWTALGSTLAAHDGGRVSPPALFAFEQAYRLAPDQPGPPFYLGLARVRAGQFAAARPLWARALMLTPADVSYRRELAQRLRLLDLYLAEIDGPPRSPAAERDGP